jgi:MerR family transcriptional regulator, thiopeptide resistance regulator
MRVTELARACGISRSTVLYYESVGLLKAARRSASGYRIYTRAELDRLQQICAWRQAGLTLEDIRLMLGRSARPGEAAAVLRRRLAEIGREILKLHGHQRAILALLKNQNKFRRTDDMTKDKWVEIMRASGFSDDDMHRWHKEFEKAAPGDHEQFLAYLQIPAEEAARIRAWSREA